MRVGEVPELVPHRPEDLPDVLSSPHEEKAVSVNHCSSHDCCPHPDESQRVLNRDGVLVVVCIECHADVGPPELATIGNNNGTPCGEDIPHRWGYL